LNETQKQIVAQFILDNPDLRVRSVDYFDNGIDVYFGDNKTPWIPQEFKSGSRTRILLESLERKLNYAKVR
jgi:hypothetical protein